MKRFMLAFMTFVVIACLAACSDPAVEPPGDTPEPTVIADDAISVTLGESYEAGTEIDLSYTVKDGYAVTVKVFKGETLVATDPGGNKFTPESAGAYSVVYRVTKDDGARDFEYEFAVTEPYIEPPEPVIAVTVPEALNGSLYVGEAIDITPTLAEGYECSESDISVTDADNTAVAVADMSSFKFPKAGVYNVEYTASNGSDTQRESVAVAVDAFRTEAEGYEYDPLNVAWEFTSDAEWATAYYTEALTGDYCFAVNVKLGDMTIAKNELPKVGVVAASGAAGELGFCLDTGVVASGTVGEVSSYVYTTGNRQCNAPCLLDPSLAATGLLKDAELDLAILRRGDTFYFFVNDVLYQSRTLELEGEVKVGICVRGQSATYADFITSYDIDGADDVLADAYFVPIKNGYANYTQKRYESGDIVFDNDNAADSGRGSLKTRAALPVGTYQGDFDVSYTVSDLAVRDATATLRRIWLYFIREDGTIDGVSLTARFDNSLVAVQYLCGESGKNQPAPTTIAQNLVKNFKDDPSYSIDEQDFEIAVSRRVTEDGSYFTAKVNGVQLNASTNFPLAAMTYKGSYTLGVACDDWSGRISDLDLKYVPAVLPEITSVGVGGDVDVAPTHIASGWDYTLKVEFGGSDVTDTVLTGGTLNVSQAGEYTLIYTFNASFTSETPELRLAVNAVVFSAPEIDTSATVKTGPVGTFIPVAPAVNYSGSADMTVTVVATCGGKTVALSGSYDSGDLSLYTLRAGTYTIDISAEYGADAPVTSSYDITVSSLGAVGVMDDGSGNKRYLSTGANAVPASKTLAWLENKAIGSTEVMFRLVNDSLNFVGSNPKKAGNTDCMAILVVFDRADGKYDLVAVDYSKAMLLGGSSNNISSDKNLTQGYISVWLYVGANSVDVPFDDPKWEKSGQGHHALGSAAFIFTSVQRRIVKDGDKLMAEYNVSFNQAKESITDHTFATRSEYIGDAEIALATVNTKATLQKLAVCYPISAFVALSAGDTVDFRTFAQTGSPSNGSGLDWTLDTVTVYNGGTELPDPTAVTIAPGTYTVIYTATADLNNSATKKTQVYTVIVTVG